MIFPVINTGEINPRGSNREDTTLSTDRRVTVFELFKCMSKKNWSSFTFHFNPRKDKDKDKDKENFILRRY